MVGIYKLGFIGELELYYLFILVFGFFVKYWYFDFNFIGLVLVFIWMLLSI